MRVVSRAEFARQIGVDRSAVTHAVRCRRLPSVEGNIDLDDPEVQRFSSSRSGMAKAAGGGRGRPVVGGAAPPVPEPELTSEEPSAPSTARSSSTFVPMAAPSAVDVAGQGRQLDNRLKAIKLASKKLEYLEQTRSVVPVEIMSRTLGQISSLLDENFRAFDERNGDELYELARTQDDRRAFAEMLSRRIDESMRVVLTSLERFVRDMRASGENA